jgi:DNA polymerase V
MSRRALIGLVDCNNFFVSCERLFRCDLIHIPTVVLSSNDGCVISRSDEAKELGVPMGIPFFQIRDLVQKHRIAVFSSNFELYRDISDRVMEVVREEFDDVEVYSIDEAFFTLPERDAVACAKRLYQKIYRGIGVPVSVGCAPTKTLAKLAAKRAKKGTQVHVMSERTLTDVHMTDIGEVWGVGKATRTILQKHQLHTIQAVVDARTSLIRELCGITGERLQCELRGIPAQSHRDSLPHSFTSSRAFGKPVTQLADLTDACAYHLSYLCEKLRAHTMWTRMAHVYLKTRTLEGEVRGIRFDVPLYTPRQDTRVIARDIIDVVRKAYRSQVAYLKVGITLSSFAENTHTTHSLFKALPERIDADLLMRQMDTVNKKYGSGTVRIGTQKRRHVWTSKREYVSPAYTTSWTQLLRVSIDL